LLGSRIRLVQRHDELIAEQRAARARVDWGVWQCESERCRNGSEQSLSKTYCCRMKKVPDALAEIPFAGSEPLRRVL
jgi:hypothetical protein